MNLQNSSILPEEYNEAAANEQKDKYNRNEIKQQRRKTCKILESKHKPQEEEHEKQHNHRKNKEHNDTHPG